MATRPVELKKGLPPEMQFKRESLDWALAHIERFGDTDIFPIPFEYDAIASHWKNEGGVREWLEKQDPSEWKCRAHRRCLVPKHRFGFRVSTQLDPLDSLAFAALVFDLGPDIEKERVEQAEEVVHSFRFAPTIAGQLYARTPNWTTFHNQSLQYARREDFEYVVIADIADFYPRLYSHPVENELIACTATQKDVAKAVLGMIKQWNQTISYGIPVGPAASRLIAELALNITDEALAARGFTYSRFSDDFHIFCVDFRTAHESLAFLAKTLFESLGLTLQQHKTRIVRCAKFSEMLVSPPRREKERLSQQFEELLASLGIDSPYKEIDYDHLSPSQKKQVDALNLGEVLREQLGLGEELDIMVTRFVLRRLAQLRDGQHLDLVVGALDALYPVFADAVIYIASVRGLSPDRHREIGKRLLEALDDTVSGHLEFHRSSVLNVFARTDRWDNTSLLAKLEPKCHDAFTRRELILARGRAGDAHWFKMEKSNFGNLGPWDRRAFLYAASCLPGDEAAHWWEGLKRAGALDILDRAIVVYAKNKPIRTK
jgi:hypothetical protein